MGVVQALLSVFLEDGDKLRCINSGRLRITFLLRSPLYYVCASSWGEPEFVVSNVPPLRIVSHSNRKDSISSRVSTPTNTEHRHCIPTPTHFRASLELWLAQVIGRCDNIYLCCTSFDCDQNTGAEPFLFSLLDRMELDLAMATSSLNCLQLDPSLRARVAEALVPTSKMKVMILPLDVTRMYQVFTRASF